MDDLEDLEQLLDPARSKNLTEDEQKKLHREAIFPLIGNILFFFVILIFCFYLASIAHKLDFDHKLAPNEHIPMFEWPAFALCLAIRLYTIMSLIYVIQKINNGSHQAIKEAKRASYWLQFDVIGAIINFLIIAYCTIAAFGFNHLLLFAELFLHCVEMLNLGSWTSAMFIHKSISWILMTDEEREEAERNAVIKMAELNQRMKGVGLL